MIYLLSFYLFPFLIFLVPCPLVILYIKYGMKEGLIGIFFVPFAILFVSNIQNATIFLIYIGILTIGIGQMVRENYHHQSILLTTSGGLISSSLIIYFSMRYFTGIDLLESFREIMMSILNDDLFQGLESVSGVVEELIETMIVMAPAVLVMTALLSAYLNYVIPVHYLAQKKMSRHLPPYPKNFHLPYGFTAMAIISLTLVFFSQYLHFPYYQEVMMNMIGVFGGLFMFNGLGTVDYYLAKKSKRSLRIILPIFLILFQFTLIYSLIGIVDSVINFRKRWK
ncbi:MAG: DUF2232 domain-containing protein [Tissierellia bacterium]|nr:DUF2232 domain-containing protein [Tissierellia bacterium]